MISSYYKIPLDTAKIVKNEDLEKSNIRQSLVSYIHLIATTYFGECTFDESFGCSIWNVDFDNLTSTSKLRHGVIDSIKEGILGQEKRLEQVEIIVKIKQEEINTPGDIVRIKKRVDIRIDGVIKQTNESFSCLEQFYIAPLSY